MDVIIAVATIASSIAWPAALLTIIFYFRHSIKSILRNLNFQLESGLTIKWKDFEFKGISIYPELKGQNDYYSAEEADQQIFLKRHEAYEKNKNLFLVHRAKKTEETLKDNGLTIYEISVYLVGHKNYGKINDVKFVEYYFGQHFGLMQFPNGCKYVIGNGSEGFAVKITAYGPTLCEARIKFHDGSETTVNRYLDFEGTGYQFNPATNSYDVQKLKSNGEG